MVLYAIVAAPFVTAILIPVLGRRFGRALVWLPVATAAVLLLALLGYLPAVVAHRPVEVAAPLVPSLGVSLAFRLDALALALALLVVGIGLLVAWYAEGYLEPDADRPAFFLYLTLFMAAMLGLVVADDLVVLFVFWELTTYSSFLLIGFHDREASARQAALTALIVTAAGGLALLAAAALLAVQVGDLRLSRLPDLLGGTEVDAGPRPWLVALVGLAAATKSAQVPFHFWLPAAMVAPTPVSAYLHSATMVNGGVYLLARFAPALGGEPVWVVGVTALGLSSMLWGGYLALRDDDAKRLLAHSTVSQLGMLVALAGLGTPQALAALTFHLVVHALFKAGLFMTAGIVDHAVGTRTLSAVSGLAGVLPATAAAAAVTGLALAGVPPAAGFFSKEGFLAALHEGPTGDLLLALGGVGSLLSFLYAWRYWLGLFAGPRETGDHALHRPGSALVVPACLLALLVLVLGLAPGPALRLAEAAAAGLLPGAGEPELHARPEWGPTLWVTLGAYAVGAALLAGWRRALPRLPAPPESASAQALYSAAYEATLGAATRLTEAYASRGLPSYLLYVTASLAALALTGVLWAGWPAWPGLPPVTSYAVLVVVLGIGGLAGSVVFRQRVPLLLSLSAVGFSVVLLFVLLRAPDLALTQFLVETLSLVLILLVLRRTPVLATDREPVLRRVAEGVAAVGAGLGVLALGAIAYVHTRFEATSRFFLEHSEALTGGANVVNMILVDFRSFDTLGEITVFGAAAVAALSVVRAAARRRSEDAALAGTEAGVEPRPEASGARIEPAAAGRRGGSTSEGPARLDRHGRPLAAARGGVTGSVVFARVTGTVVVPIVMLLAAFLFLRGASHPGGGFAAGLLAVAALVLRALAAEEPTEGRRIPIELAPAVGAGLAVAWLTGAGALLFGEPFFASAHGHLTVPLIGALPWETSMLFELGVFVVVVAAVRLLLETMAAGA